MINALSFQFMSVRADVPKYNNNVPLNGVSCLAAQRSDALPWWKLYLDSCASYHTVIDESIVTSTPSRIGTARKLYNASFTSSTSQGTLTKRFPVWINPTGIANLLSIPILEAVSYSSGSKWIVTTPEGEENVFKAEETGVTMGMPYIDIREHTEGVAMLQASVSRRQYENFYPPRNQGCHRRP